MQGIGPVTYLQHYTCVGRTGHHKAVSACGVPAPTPLCVPHAADGIVRLLDAYSCSCAKLLRSHQRRGVAALQLACECHGVAPEMLVCLSVDSPGWLALRVRSSLTMAKLRRSLRNVGFGGFVDFIKLLMAQVPAN